MSRKYFLNFSKLTKFLILFIFILFLFFILQFIKLKTDIYNKEKILNKNYYIKIFMIIYLIIFPFIFIYILFLKKKNIFYFYFSLYYSSILSNFYDYYKLSKMRDYLNFNNYFFYNLEDLIIIIVFLMIIINLFIYNLKVINKKHE